METGFSKIAEMQLPWSAGILPAVRRHPDGGYRGTAPDACEF